jgi:hypothetical protein
LNTYKKANSNRDGLFTVVVFGILEFFLTPMTFSNLKMNIDAAKMYVLYPNPRAII